MIVTSDLSKSSEPIRARDNRIERDAAPDNSINIALRAKAIRQ